MYHQCRIQGDDIWSIAQECSVEEVQEWQNQAASAQGFLLEKKPRAVPPNALRPQAPQQKASVLLISALDDLTGPMHVTRHADREYFGRN